MNPALACPSSCPIVAARQEALRFPVGQLHRVAPGSGEEGEVDETRRNVLKLLAVAGILGVGVAGGVGGALQYAQPPTIGLTSYPKVQLLDVDGSPLTVSKVDANYSAKSYQGVNPPPVFTFNYPLLNEPNFLIDLLGNTGSNGPVTNVPGGIGSSGTIVGFSAICQHLGCPAPAIAYYPPAIAERTFSDQYGTIQFYIHCSCHGSTYDVANSAANLTGPAIVPLPQVELTTDASGNIYAVGMRGAPVKGHLNTLTGDYGVGATSQLTKQSAVIVSGWG